ncbi:Ornithine racemase [subsurface metagenome]|jgi:predicted amino acid racemase
MELCKSHDIEVTFVTKGFCAYPQIVEAVLRSGIKMLADSRISNLKKLCKFQVPKMFLRIPMMSELDDVLEYADIVLMSEIEIAKVLGRKATNKNKRQKIIIMVDLGDLREGFWLDDVVEAVGEFIYIEGIKLIGIGTNLSCYGGIIPSRKNLGNLLRFAREIEESYNISLDMISGGNTSSMSLVINNQIPQKINNLRIGEGILLARDEIFDKRPENFYNDTFILKAEVVEVKQKPSVPIGEIGRDTFGNVPIFKDKGIINRAIIAVGRQDVDPENLIPEDDRIMVLGGSSDHIILDINDCKKDYKVGDIINFKLTYAGMLRAMTSPYVEKVFI